MPPGSRGITTVLRWWDDRLWLLTGLACAVVRGGHCVIALIIDGQLSSGDIMAHCNECCQVIGTVSLGLHDVPDLCVDFRDEILKSVNDPVCHILHVSTLLRVIDSPVIIGAV